MSVTVSTLRGSISGQIQDGAGRPIPDARLVILEGPGHSDIAPLSDEEGQLELGPLAPGAYRLQAHSDQGSSDPVSVQVQPGQVTTVQVVIGRAMVG